ncbi:MAG: hypothetical protein R3F20_08105 [Planctomycetota bacterium]
MRSALRVNELRAAGFTGAVVLEGGYPAWTQRGLPVDRGWDMEPLLEDGDRR